MAGTHRTWGTRPVSRRAVLRGTAIGGIGLAASALVGCGSGATKAPAPAGTGTAAGTAAASNGAGTPQMSESFVLVQTRDAVSLEPLDANVYTIPERIGLVYPRLLASVLADPKDPTSIKWAPSYAVESMETADGGKQLTFKLKKGVKYQNVAPLNGREFSSADVKFSIDRYMTHPKSTFKTRFGDVDSVTTPDKYTVVIKAKQPSRYLISALQAETALMTPPEIEKDYKTKAIGPGPYIHEQYLQGEGSTFKKNPDYIDAKNIWFNRYLVKVIADAATRNAALKTNQVDYIDSSTLTPADRKTVESASVTVYQALAAGVQNVSWNLKNPKFQDYRLRLAMSKAFDRQALIDQTLQASAKWSGIMPVDFGGMALSEAEVKSNNVMKYDPAEAKKLFAAAGGKAGMTVEYYYNPNGTSDSVQTQLIARQWEANLGIKTTLKTEDYSIFLPKEYLGGYNEMFTTGYSLPNWHENLFAPYLKGGNRNGTGFEDATVTKMADEIKQTLDDKQAFDKSKKLQLYIWEKHLPMTQRPLPISFNGYNAKLRNFPQPGNYPPGMEWMYGAWKAK